ncbi:hypothetical protein ACFWNQ_24975 [Streptomyces virginiae]|uniref:hypothetical protein n=1 Tax=Streptomyces virginiae TaxID=1961 RepID=UPI003646CEA2
MIVHRIRTDRGSHIEPALDPAWPDATKLQWHAAVTALDTGLPIHVHVAARSEYGLTVGNTGAAPFTYREAWEYLNGASAGATAARHADRHRNQPKGK